MDLRLTLLLIGCPCALVISTPAAITSGWRRRLAGALIKGGAALERLSRVQALAFDKTGTLTAGKPQVTDVQPFGADAQQQLLSLAAAIEQGSGHAGAGDSGGSAAPAAGDSTGAASANAGRQRHSRADRRRDASTAGTA